MYGDMIRRLIFQELENYKVGCNRSHLTEDSITYAELIFKDKTKSHALQTDTDMIIHKVKCGSCYCEPKRL